MDKLVFDIETKNSFADVGGRDNLKALEVSVVCAYSYDEDKYFTFEERELAALGELMKKAMLVGFSSRRFDVPVLEKYLNFNIVGLPHYDILDEIEQSFGRRIGLDALARANLGEAHGKSATGLDAIEFYRRGEIQKLKDYCLQDVKATREIFDLIRKQGFLWVPRRDQPQMAKVELVFAEPEIPAQSSLF